MRYNPHIYAKAFTEAFDSKRGNEGEKIARFIKLLKRNGDFKHINKIIQEAEKISLKSAGAKKVVVESARLLEKTTMAEIKGSFKKGDVIENKINMELIAGAKITIDGEWVIDASLRGRLKKLLKSS